MTKLTDSLKRMLDALAHADAGEYLTPRQKAACLKPLADIAQTAPISHIPETAAATPAASRQQVALYMGSELSSDMMNYVMQTCARLNHGLTVLTFQPDNDASALLDPYKEMLQSMGIAMQLVVLTGEPIAGLIRYLRRHPEVAFLACNETGYLGRSVLNGSQRTSTLPVPVVLVEAQTKTTKLGSDNAAANARIA